MRRDHHGRPRAGGMLAAVGVALSVALGVGAADYPTREIELVVSFPAGGPADTSARIIAPKLSALLRQPVVVANKPGGGGAVGADYVARARPDGYTVYASTNSVLTITPHLVKSLPYKVSDFTAIGAYAVDLGVITTRAGGPARTLEEFVEYAKKFVEYAKKNLTHVPFQGTGPVKNAVMGGHVTVATSGFGSLSPLIRSGDLIYVPARTPRAVQDTLVKALGQAARDPAVASAMEKAGMQVEYKDPAETQKALEAESSSVGKVAEKLDLPKQ